MATAETGVVTNISTNILNNATDLGSGWKYTTWFGVLYDPGNTWVFHADHSWLYPVNSAEDSVWVYSPGMDWFWTDPDVYPWIYFDALSGWRYFIAGVGYYDPTTEEWTDQATFLADFPSGQVSSELIGKIVLSTTEGIVYYKADSQATDGWTQVGEESQSSLLEDLIYLQGDTGFERRARLIVDNYRNQVAAGGPVTMTVGGQSVVNALTIEHDTGNDQMVVTGNGVPNYIPTLVGLDVSEGWNTPLNGGFESLKLSEENEGSSGNNNPNSIAEAEEVFRVPLTPVNNASATDTELGTVGVSLNGVPIFNPFEDPDETAAYGRIFSSCCGHPQQQGQYHYHKYPTCLRLIKDDFKTEKDKCDEIDALLVEGGHSPLLGFAVDGWPVYGPVGWRSAQAQTGVIMLSSYTGSADSSGNASYVEGSGDLDECGGLVSPTPEFPEGIYHYHMTIEADTDGSVLRYLNPYFGYDVRNTLNKHGKMPASWSDDATYVSELKAGFNVDGVSIDGTDSYSTFVNFIAGMQATLEGNGMADVAAEFETMQIAYPFTIRMYRGTPTASGVIDTGGDTGGDNGGDVTTNGVVSISPETGTKGNSVPVVITLDSNINPPLPPTDAPAPTVTIGGVSLTGVSRTSTTSISGTYAIPSNASGTQDVIVTFQTLHGDLELTGAGFFTVQ